MQRILGVVGKTIAAGSDIIAMPGDPTPSIRQTEKVFFVMKVDTIYRNDLERK
jgi:hypothetical protein